MIFAHTPMFWFFIKGQKEQPNDARMQVGKGYLVRRKS